MYAIKNKNLENQSYMEVTNQTIGLSAVINLTEGCRLQALSFGGVPIIKEISSFPYQQSYASSFLFPFVSRTESGTFTYKGKEYVLHKNEPGGKNALHGLIYNKPFQFVESKENNGVVTLLFTYEEREQPKGFPFDYQVSINYSFGSNGMSIGMEIENKSLSSFPFTIGWHPYFYMPNKETSSLAFKSSRSVLFDENLITKKIITQQSPKRIELSGKSFDDCFLLDSKSTCFDTENYRLEISSDDKENFLQIYTPPNLPLIAIEPMVGLSNSLNNKIGLQELNSGETYSITWSVNIKTKANE